MNSSTWAMPTFLRRGASTHFLSLKFNARPTPCCRVCVSLLVECTVRLCRFPQMLVLLTEVRQKTRHHRRET